MRVRVRVLLDRSMRHATLYRAIVRLPNIGCPHAECWLLAVDSTLLVTVNSHYAGKVRAGNRKEFQFDHAFGYVLLQPRSLACPHK